MKIHVYTICWNEAKLLPFFIRHYQQFADKIFFYDNESTDNSREIIEGADKCFYHPFSSSGEIRDDIFKQIKNNAWKESRGEADFVIVVDLDEFVYSKRLVKSLKLLRKANVSLIRPEGYDMIAEHFDWNSREQITDLVKHGSRFNKMNKPCIFDPNKVEEINYTSGAHNCNWKGTGFQYGTKGLPQILGSKFYLLHYKALTSDHLVKRIGLLRTRLSKQNIASGHGLHYIKPDSHYINEFESALVKRRKVI
jgi:glycosyl transferase family 2